MIDGGDRDEKILCVPDKNPRYTQVKSLKDVAPRRLDEIAEFFRSYKNLEKKVTEILGWQDVGQGCSFLSKNPSKLIEDNRRVRSSGVVRVINFYSSSPNSFTARLIASLLINFACYESQKLPPNPKPKCSVLSFWQKFIIAPLRGRI